MARARARTGGCGSIVGVTATGSRTAPRPLERPTRLTAAFRWVAIVEALSWLALIVATGIKYTTDPMMEGGVKVLGPVHGALFTGYVVLALVVAWKLRWKLTTLFVVLVDSVIPGGGFLVARRADLR